VIEQVSAKRPKEGIYLAGKIGPKSFTTDREDADEAVYLIDYPFDHFYVEKGKGSEWEKNFAKGKSIVSLQVKNGYAILKNVK
jgi:hypothetical protein